MDREVWSRAGNCDTGACVEVAVVALARAQHDWTKARCDTSACVEVTVVRDAPGQSGGAVGQSGGAVEIAKHEGMYFMRNSARPDTVVAYTEEEWDVFTHGVVAGEFAV